MALYEEVRRGGCALATHNLVLEVLWDDVVDRAAREAFARACIEAHPEAVRERGYTQRNISGLAQLACLPNR